MDPWTGRGDMGRLSFSSECSSEDDGAGPGPPAKRPRTDYVPVARKSAASDSEDDLNVQPSFTSPHQATRALAPGDFISKADPNKPKGAGYSNFAEKMMEKMGFQKGKGLGRHGQGRRDIVEASKHKGRRGLGMVVPMFEPADVQWKFELEEVSPREKLDWLPVCELPPLDLEEMQDWIVVDKVKLDIGDETEFCSQQTLTTVLSCKDVFDSLESEQMRRARTRSNPYETIKGVFFQNRAAMKMANMDAVLDFMFTQPTTLHGEPALGQDELLYFADVCAGPGGFSEYVLWRKKLGVKGFGFTLRGECDFKLHEFFSASSEFFEPHYGVDGASGDGDIYRPDNQETFQKFVLESTDNKGVHFVMADGGFSVEGQENIQEILSKRLYLCQFLVALSILREGGHFVCKLFDIFTPFSVGLVYLMYRAFHQVAIIKPVTSRPANSERYIVCKWKRQDSLSVLEYMRQINECLDDNTKRRTGKDVRDVVPLDILQEDEAFFNYIVTSNEMLGKQQAIALSKIQTFAQNNDLLEARQAEMRRECLKIWQVPDELRKAPTRALKPDIKFNEIVKDRKSLAVLPKRLALSNLDASIRSLYDYRCAISGSNDRWFLLCLGRTFVYQWNGHVNGKWNKVTDRTLEIPADTLLEVEFVEEFKGQGSGQQKKRVVHVIDGWMLAGQDISNLHFMLRLQKIAKFVRAISRPTRYDLSAIQVKQLYKCEEIGSLFSGDSLQVKMMKGSSRQQKVCYHRTPEQYFVPAGVYFIKTVRDPWMMAVSSKGLKYFYNTISRESTHQTPADSIASFADCVKSRLLWKWDEGVKIHPAQQSDDPEKISAVKMQDFVHKHTKRK